MQPKLMIDIDGNEVQITGRRETMEKSVDLHLLNYVEIEGFIQTEYFRDPVEYAGQAAANGALRMARRNRK